MDEKKRSLGKLKANRASETEDRGRKAEDKDAKIRPQETVHGHSQKIEAR